MVVEKGIHHACPQLPRSLWEGIFCRLDINSITNAAASCRDFSLFATSDFVWQQLYQVNAAQEMVEKSVYWRISCICVSKVTLALTCFGPCASCLQRDWSCCENAHSGQSAASVLGAPARLLDAQSFTECIVAQVQRFTWLFGLILAHC